MTDDLGSSHVRTDSGELSDAELVRETRQGSRRAYAALWKRHSAGAIKYAKTLTTSDADDVVSEAFLKVYAAIRAGRGPEEDFRYYIRSAVRNTYVSMARVRRPAPAGDAIEDVVGDSGAEIATVRSFDGSATARAFLSLPARWQEVLWYTEVEGFSRERTADVLGIKANAVSALSFRARDALRTAWLQEHISTRSDLDRGCGASTPLLGAYSRRGLSRRDRLRVEHHVKDCPRCTSVVEELLELLTPGRHALVLLPAALTGGGLAAFASKMSGGSAILASASAIAAPTTALTVTAGGGAASGAVALSVVSKVAACALVATMMVPPSQLLLEAAQHPVRQSEPSPERAEDPAENAAISYAEAAISTVRGVDDTAPVAIDPQIDASPDGPFADGRSGADEAWHGEEPGLRGSAFADTGVGSSGGRPSAVGGAKPLPADDASPSPTASDSDTAAAKGKASPRSADAEAAPGEQTSAKAAPAARENASDARGASGSDPSKPTDGADAGARSGAGPNDKANAGSAAAAGDKASPKENEADPAGSPADRAPAAPPAAPGEASAAGSPPRDAQVRETSAPAADRTPPDAAPGLAVAAAASTGG